jgi:hypothetical protein
VQRDINRGPLRGLNDHARLFVLPETLGSDAKIVTTRLKERDRISAVAIRGQVLGRTLIRT